MDATESDVVIRAAKAIFEDCLIEDWELDTVMGLTRQEGRALIRVWPELPATAEHFAFINNCLNQFFGPLNLPDADLVERVGANHQTVANLLASLRQRAFEIGLCK